MGAAEKLPHLFSEPEVADYLGISTITLARYRKSGKIGCTERDEGMGYTHKQIMDFLGKSAEATSLPTALYRHFNRTGELLYVGISLNALSRLDQHVKGSHWSRDIASVTIEWLDSTADALKAEQQAIDNEKPLHNIRGVKRPS